MKMKTVLAMKIVLAVEDVLPNQNNDDDDHETETISPQPF